MNYIKEASFYIMDRDRDWIDIYVTPCIEYCSCILYFLAIYKLSVIVIGGSSLGADDILPNGGSLWENHIVHLTGRFLSAAIYQ